MSSKIIVCDVDGVVVDLSYQWYLYLRGIVKDISFTYEELAAYYNFHQNLCKYISEQEAMWFWKRDNLYDTATPIDNSVESLWALKKLGFSVVFASHVAGNHAKSKYEFLKRYFPVDGFMATREKHFLRADIAIDDRIEHLVNHPLQVGKVLKYTPHKQSYKGHFDPDMVLYDWNTSSVDQLVSLYESKLVVYR